MKLRYVRNHCYVFLDIVRRDLVKNIVELNCLYC